MVIAGGDGDFELQVGDKFIWRIKSFNFFVIFQVKHEVEGSSWHFELLSCNLLVLLRLS